MKLAIISDIHGNLPALEAVLAAIEQDGIDQTYCLGDLVNFAPWTNEVIEMIRAHNIPTVCGNHDWGIGLGQQNFAFSYHTAEEKEAGLKAIAFTNQNITEANRNYLRSLPKILRLDYELSSGMTDILLTHGSPRSIGEYLFEDFETAILMKIMDEYSADVLVTGHTHRSYIRKLEKAGGKWRYALNAGSVGKPKDGDPRASYLLLSMEHGQLTAEVKRVSYNIVKSQQAIRLSGIPDIYAELLIKA